MPDLQNHINEQITRLEYCVESHITLHKWILSHHMRPFDLYLNGVAQRSISLIHGFVDLVKSRNALCALGLIRMQIDTLMRLYGCTLVGDPDRIVLHVLGGEPFYKLKSKDGHELRDGYLRRELAKQFDWIENAYNLTSEYIHFSDRHIRSTIRSLDDNGKLSMLISRKPPEWDDIEVCDAIECFGHTTDAILALCYRYMEQKHATNEMVDNLEDERSGEDNLS